MPLQLENQLVDTNDEGGYQTEAADTYQEARRAMTSVIADPGVHW